MEIKPKRPRIEKTIKLIDIKMYEDAKQKKANVLDPDKIKNTPTDLSPDSEGGIEEGTEQGA